MGYLKTIQAAKAYLRRETTRQASFGHLPQVLPELTIFKDATINPDGTVLLLIEQGYERHLFDAPVVLAFELGMGLGSRLRINSRGPKAAGTAHAYVRLDTPRGGAKLPLNMQVNRIIADPEIGRRVRDNPSDYHNHLREGLRTDENPVEYGPGKAHTRRWDAIEAILEAYDHAPEEARQAVQREDLEHLLSGLLVLADGRAVERQMMTLKRTA